MRARHPVPVPVAWLMTDERMGDDLWRALARLPRGSGVIVRHYSLSLAARCALFKRIARIGKRRGLIVIRAGDDRLAVHEGGVHGRLRQRARQCNPGQHRRDLRTWPAHDRHELWAGLRAGADAIFVSPVAATRSHPGAKPIGRWQAAAMARMIGKGGSVAVALGGVDARAFRRLNATGFHGWAAIDAWTMRAQGTTNVTLIQKRMTVPT